MAFAASSPPRASVDGKFFRLGEKKFYAKGVAYGPFTPNAAGQPFASPEQTAQDFAQIRDLGANLLRVYHVPAKWFLDLALEHQLRVLVDVPWNQHLCFLDAAEHRASAIEAVRRAVYSCGRHPAVFAYSVANEIPADIVRWHGAEAVGAFIDDLVAEAKRIDPECLCTYTNFPTTEFLRPRSVDFLCFNVYLHQESAFRSYLARLQMIADGKPLVLGECGVDALREGTDRQAEILGWQLERAFRCGLAGAVVFRHSDDWWRGGTQVEDWQMGLTDRDRHPRPAFFTVQRVFTHAPYFPLAAKPKVSVVVASYNGDRTLRACLESLLQLNYTDYEVILVDDGSTDATRELAAKFPAVRYIRHERNLGLSVARNTGIAAAAGELVAFTDADCRADPDWLHYAVSDLVGSEFAGMGGPNLLPPEDSPVAAAVMASPGGPAHVMLTDTQAEHIPGCNMILLKTALESIGGFDPVFTKAGDDVDVCWRLQQAGCRIGFSPAALVWHYRRSTVGEYLKQQRGYGEAEALLVRKHPEYFNSIGGSIWRGRIYASSPPGLRLRRPIIYRGLFGSAPFQSLYSSEPSLTLMLCTSLEYHVLVALPLWVLTVTVPMLWPLSVVATLCSLAVCATSAKQAELPWNRRHWWSRPLVALLFFLQPIVRGWARYRGRLFQASREAPAPSLDSLALRASGESLRERHYWSEKRRERLEVVREILARLERAGWPSRSDAGWSEYDLEVYGARWSYLQITTAAEEHSQGRQMVRFRLSPRWTFQARAALYGICGVLALVLSLLAENHRWLWALLLLLPLFVWLLQRQQRSLQSRVAVLLDQFARENGMQRQGEPMQPAVSPTPTPASPASNPFGEAATDRAGP